MATRLAKPTSLPENVLSPIPIHYCLQKTRGAREPQAGGQGRCPALLRHRGKNRPRRVGGLAQGHRGQRVMTASVATDLESGPEIHHPRGLTAGSSVRPRTRRTPETRPPALCPPGRWGSRFRGASEEMGHRRGSVGATAHSVGKPRAGIATHWPQDARAPCLPGLAGWRRRHSDQARGRAHPSPAVGTWLPVCPLRASVPSPGDLGYRPVPR